MKKTILALSILLASSNALALDVDDVQCHNNSGYITFKLYASIWDELKYQNLNISGIDKDSYEGWRTVKKPIEAVIGGLQYSISMYQETSLNNIGSFSITTQAGDILWRSNCS